MKVYDDKDEEVLEYIGCYYPMQNKPQSIYLEINSENSPIIDYNREVGSNAVPERVWNGRAIRISLPSSCYKKYEVDWILQNLKEDIEKIQESYTEKYKNGNLYGHFDQNLVDMLSCKVEDSKYKSECWFDIDGIMDKEN